MTKTIIPVLQQMLACCEKIQVFLQTDQDYLRKNTISKMTGSNQKKTELLFELQSLMENFQLQKQQLQQQGGDQTLVNQLRDEINKCYQYIMTNSQVIFANLHQLKLMHDRFIMQQQVTPGVYDCKGTVK